MKAELIALRRKLDTMFKNQAPSHLVNEVRNSELAKIMKKREDDIATSVKNLAQAKQDLIDAAIYKPVDDSEALARRLRVESELAAMNRGALLRYDTEDPEILHMKAATLRKRGMHDEADEVYSKIEIAKLAPYHSPMVKSIETEITRYGMLKPSADKDQLWIGTDVHNVKREDFASVVDGKISFKDGDTEVSV